MEKQVDSETHTRSHAFAYIYTSKKKFYRQFECSKHKSNCEKKINCTITFFHFSECGLQNVGLK